ncbi:type II toxin-antitoxin system VapC family toxin [Trabulsiella odontotermitis]|uniref:type II toxin-antitoxin system VapC family toxin n=1 Tax=Trabulsiella odontotermitis TaxID=379893 RepID=UPI0006BA158E|nr:type II toxin-antitoxin system VapC family toxin [Trabulsiella odontotermitis]
MYMLDTNTVSYLFRQNPIVMAKIQNTPVTEVCISSITEAELRYGAAKRQSKPLLRLIESFLDIAQVVVWDSQAALVYGEQRASMERTGLVMGALDQLIAAHATSMGMTIVTSDTAFSMVPGLVVEDWTKE